MSSSFGISNYKTWTFFETGYVLSRDALDRFVNRALKDKSGIICKTNDDTGKAKNVAI